MKSFICKEDLYQRLMDEAEKAELRAETNRTLSQRAANAEVQAYLRAAAIVNDATEYQV